MTSENRRIEMFSDLAKQWIRDGSPKEAAAYATLAAHEANQQKKQEQRRGHTHSWVNGHCCGCRGTQCCKDTAKGWRCKNRIVNPSDWEPNAKLDKWACSKHQALSEVSRNS